MRKTKSQIRAAEIARLQSEQDAQERNIRESMKSAAFARCAAVEELYEMLDVKPEPPKLREGRSGQVQVSSDKDETKRSRRLLDTIAEVLAERDDLVAAGQRQPQASPVPGAVGAPYGQPLGLRPTG